MGEAKMKLSAASERHQRLRSAVMEAIRKEGAEIPAEEILAVLAYSVGQVIAVQDQRAITPEMALNLVMRNVEAGNADALRELLSAKGTKQ